MRKIMKSTIQVSIAMLFLSSLLFGSPLFIAPASATDIPVTPINKVINATQGGTFVLRYKMIFDKTDLGFFALTFYWDVNETDPNGKYWNFTYESFLAKFTDGTDFTVPVNATILKGSAPSLPGVYRYSVTIEELNETKNGAFWVNATMRAAGQGSSYINHTAPAYQNITCSSTYAAEYTVVSVPQGDVKIYIAPLGVHDVAVIDVTVFKTVVGQGYKDEINVTVENQGIYQESFNVILYYKNTSYTGTIGTQTVTTLAAGAKKLLIFIWSTDAKVKRRQSYTIIANASIVSGEVDTADNKLTKVDAVKVTIPGDIDGDWYVFTKDIGYIGKAWNSKRGTPKYIPNADIDCDGTIFTKDIGIVGKNWKKYA